MPKVTAAHLEARKKQILHGAMVCFSKKGFHQTTMQDICTKARLSPGAVYRYFSGKEEIIRAMFDENLQRELTMIKEINESSADSKHGLDEMAAVFFGMLERPQRCSLELNIELWAESFRNPRIMEFRRKIVDAIIHAIASVIRQAQERGEINPKLDPEYIARVMVSHYHGLLLQKASDPQVEVSKFVATMKEMTRGLFILEMEGDAALAPRRRKR